MITSRVQRMIRGLGGLLAALVVTACGGGGSGPGGTGADRLVVGSGEELRVAAGTVLSGVGGIDVLGRIVVEPGEGGLTLIAENGDVNLHGSIVVLSAGTIAAGTGAGRARIMAAAGQRSMASAAAAPGVNGGGILVEARGGNIIIGGAHFMITGDGGPAAAVALDALAAGSAVEVEYRAPAGGDAGDIVLRAPSGAVVFRPRDASDPPPFHLGNGGAGADLAVAADLRVASERVFYVAGAGGESGRFDVDAPGLEGAAGIARFFAHGRGGDGGAASWTPSTSPPLPALAELVTVRGGDGGEGTLAGGRGGDARLEGQGVMHDPRAGGSARSTTFAAVAGAGGATNDAAPIVSGAQDEYQGGRGGNAHATGHRGWDGSATADGRGGDGGRVNLFGGSGGAVQAHANARGGRGGDASAVSGDGGDGEDRCAVGAGGQGGDAGSLQARAGRGGDVIAPVAGGALVGSGGDGGIVTRADVGKPGRGGRGSPAGNEGSEGVVIALFGGEGGRGAELGFLGTIPEVIYGLAALPDPCDVAQEAPDICDPPSPLWTYHVEVSATLSFSASGSRSSGSTDYEVSISQTMTVAAAGIYPSLWTLPAAGQARVSHSSTSPGGTIEVSIAGPVGGGDDGEDNPPSDFYGAMPGVSASLDRQSCTWTVYTVGGSLRTQRVDPYGTRELPYVLGHFRLSDLPASGSRSIPFDDCWPWGDISPCAGSFGSGQSFWSSGAGAEVPPPLDVDWAITVTPVRNPHYR